MKQKINFFCMRTNEKHLVSAYTGRNRSMIRFHLCYVNDSTVRTVNMRSQSSVSTLLTKIVEMTLNTPFCAITENSVRSISNSGKSFHVN